jgi:hypothetical protein
MKRKGQIQISFGMIFSIILVIATIAVGFYVINHFLNLSSCTKVGLFWNSLTDEVDKAWNSDMTQTIFKGDVPSGIGYICFGNFSLTPENNVVTRNIFSELKEFGEDNKNSFMYPPKKACELAFYDLKHARFDSFFCVQAKSGVVNIKLSFKSSTNALVTLSKP